MMWTFKDPWILILLPLLVAGVWFVSRQQHSSGMIFPSLYLTKDVSSSWKVKLQWIPFLIRIFALGLFVIALAGPRSVLEETVVTAEGVDIVLSVDTSTSMRAEDFVVEQQRQNRLTVVKQVIKDFIDQREFDRIALIAFAGRAYTVSPLTTDYDWLSKNLERIDFGLIEDGTAIGSSIASAVSRLRDSDAKSRVIVLLTDGVNNAGNIDPLTAARTAQALGIKIYTIGAGTEGYAPYPVQDFFGRMQYRKVRIEIDESMLQEIADITGGQYFRATDTASLKQIYTEIDQLEKTKIEETGFREYNELFHFPLVAALMLITLEVILVNTVFFRVP